MRGEKERKGEKRREREKEETTQAADGRRVMVTPAGRRYRPWKGKERKGKART